MEINLYQVIGELYVRNLMLEKSGIFPMEADGIQVPLDEAGQANNVLADALRNVDTGTSVEGEARDEGEARSGGAGS